MTIARTGQTTDYSNQGTEFEVDSKTTDSAEISESSYSPDFNKWHGYYREIPELRAVINKLASWTFGRAINAKGSNKKKLERIKGFGKDNARNVLKNCWRTALICGDSFAHIIRDKQGRILNLKPLDPEKIKIVANAEGIIIRYEQEGTPKKYDPEDIYHLSYERIADEIHGIPFPEALEKLILARNEILSDLRELYHRTVFPTNIFEAETDDQTKLNSIEATLNEAYKKHENVVVPEGVFKEIKRVSQPQYAGDDAGALNFLKFLVRVFITAVGMPEVVMGWGEETTESSSKIILISYEQEIWDMKLYNEDQAKDQLGITFTIEPAPSLMDELVADQKKDKGHESKSKLDPNKDG